MTEHQSVLGFAGEAPRPVECLGQTFPSDDVRRAHFLEKLAEKLKDPVFRKTPGFPKGTDEDILRLSDPPYYTACPNPFLEEFVRVYGKPFDPNETYEREPMAIDVSEGKTDPLYKAHGYHTKVPHLAIVPSILHYTQPGDIVFDGFCGTGMTGVAAQWCGTAPSEYRKKLEDQWKTEGREKPIWGARRVILGDLSPAATFIAAGYNLPFDVEAFSTAAERILKEVEDELGWMYETLHTDGKTKGRINYTVWGEVFTCPECTGEVNFVEEALDEETKRVHETFPCPTCRVELTKDNLERSFETLIDPASAGPWKRVRMKPVLVNYRIGSKDFEKQATAEDVKLLEKIKVLPFPSKFPTNRFPIERMYHGSRLAPKGFTHVHHLFLARQLHSLAALWAKVSKINGPLLRRALLFFVDHAMWGLSILNRYKPIQYGRPGGSQVNNYLDGVYYIPSQVAECSIWYNLSPRIERLQRVFRGSPSRSGMAAISTSTCTSLGAQDESIDYIFTDPPFGENKFYSDLNYLVESWHRVLTDSEPEAIVDRAKNKGIHEYQDLMRRCFAEYFRVLKPGRWMTVVFSNSSNAIWRAIQEAMGTAGFVVADVRTLDKKQGSYRQVTSSAVKQDLVISAYKPPETLTKQFQLGSSSPEAAWAFITEHLRHAPRFVSHDGKASIIVERTAQMLHDRMVAFHVQRGLMIPFSTAEFLEGLSLLEGRSFLVRDGMYFLLDQVSEYERKRGNVSEPENLELFVIDESSAIQWLRQQLSQKPQTFQDLQPQFMKEQAWSKHEKTVELKEILDQNFLRYEGLGPVPSQIHSYLSTNFKDLRNLEKDDPALKTKALERWYVPDPNKQAERERIREKALLKEFAEYRAAKKKLKEFRLEAVRAGFKAAFAANDYQTILDVGAKLPEAVLQEDEKLFMYDDVARTRLSKD